MTQNSMRLSWGRDELNRRLREIMTDIHARCEADGRESDQYVNYLKGANIAGFKKVADAMLAYGVM
jgi:glutamate dehydrogenase (NADP+)